jgi:hypothetical protein
MDYGLDDRVSIPGGGRVFFLYYAMPRSALGPTQPPIQWIMWGLSLGVKRPGREADQSPPSSALLIESYTSFEV